MILPSSLVRPLKEQPGLVQTCARAVLFSIGWTWNHLRLARGARRRCCGRSLSMARRTVRRSVRTKSRTDRVAEPSSDGAVRFHPSLEQRLHIQPFTLSRAQGLTRLIHPILVCALGEQERPQASSPALPGDGFAVADEQAGHGLRRLGGEPHDRVCALLDRKGRLMASHVGLDPPGADGVDGDV